MTDTRVLFAESITTGFYVVLTFERAGQSVKVNYSVRSRTPQPVAAMLCVSSAWQSWVKGIVGGVVPPLPKGWRLFDGEQEGATSRTPNHNH